MNQLAEDVKLDCVDLSQHIGTEVRGLDLNKPLSRPIVDALHKVWVGRALLVFRGQKLT